MLNFNKTNYELRKFGLIFSTYLLLFVSLFLFFHRDAISSAQTWILVFFTLFLLFMYKPKLLLPLNFIWDTIFKILHWINLRLILGLVFFTIFLAIGVYRRIFKIDTLNLNFKNQHSTYKSITPHSEIRDIRKPY